MQMNDRFKTRVAAGLGVLAVTAGASAATLAPAHAAASDTDRPKITASHFDFGKNWALGAPVNGGYAYWDLSSGVTTIEVEGYLYLTDQECGRVRVEYYDDDHDLLTTKSSGTECAPGNGKTQWWKSLTYSSTTVSHIHVIVQKQKNNGDYVDKGTATATFD